MSRGVGRGALTTATAVLLLVVGALTSAATVLLHPHWWGLAWGFAAGAASVRFLPVAWWGRFAFVAGWLVVTTVVLLGRPEGDFLVANTVLGYLYLASGAVLVLVAALGREQGRGTAPRAGSGPGPEGSPRGPR